MSVDWSRPIEAVDNNGKVYQVYRRDSSAFPGWPDESGQYWTDGEVGRGLWNSDGTYAASDKKYLRIRNVPQPAPTPDDLMKRMEELVRHAAKNASGYTQEEARAIVALLPAPGDLDLFEARKLATHHSCMDIDYLGGGGDQTQLVQIALAAIKRGRALERGEP